MKKRYVNADGQTNIKTMKDLRKWQKERRGKKKDLSFKVPQIEPNLSLISSNRQQPTVTFIGHSTFLIQLGGLNIVTDPVWAMRMGFSKRLSPPGVPMTSLPEIDVVVLSHAHYDHLHIDSLRNLPGDYLTLAPEGLGDFLRRKGIRKVQEFSWWSEEVIENVTFSFVPAKHWTRRTPWDTNSSHWGGWIMQANNECVYFAGDSGYDTIFREIGEKYPNIQVALIPIGAYEPEWFMGDSHMTPEEAIQTFLDVDATTFIPMHYDAFRLVDDTAKEALDRLEKEWSKREISEDKLWKMALGETKVWGKEA